MPVWTSVIEHCALTDRGTLVAVMKIFLVFFSAWRTISEWSKSFLVAKNRL